MLPRRKAEHADLHGIIGQNGEKRRRTTHQATQPLRGEGIKCAGIADVPRHGDIPHRKHQKNAGDDQESKRNARPVSRSMESGTPPATAVKGAAAETTRKVTAATPRLFFRN